MGVLEVLTAHSDAILIAIIVAVVGAIPGTIGAIATLFNGRATARNAAAIADMHDCLDQHDAKVTAAIERADAHRGTTPDWDRVERRVGPKDRRG